MGLFFFSFFLWGDFWDWLADGEPEFVPCGVREFGCPQVCSLVGCWLLIVDC